ncbi:hypothetical protein KL905_001480 [Ogataea polymorpha]|nr:hypothetical protein KL937_002871 [Ogataea polymorpha]KAG7893076.1 hypothetical protein KL936_001250 [Ogataea polymorpha]KAG7897073.1 hypothetical protein KL908_000475 [Ogataea polymorpha]KAG7903121.1 hypothetical protein KL935_000653 [Ogataea polymorpha]KAG7912273.1 hypothetical protein KL906_000477 [Ogataea polymorpha]
MSETVLLVNENKMPTYLSHAPTQLPSLDSVLSKIQSEQKWPLPNPTTPHLLALPAPPALLQPLSRPDIPSFNMPLASIRYTRQDPPHHVAPKVSLPTPEIATRPEKNSDSSPPMQPHMSIRRLRRKVLATGQLHATLQDTPEHQEDEETRQERLGIHSTSNPLAVFPYSSIPNLCTARFSVRRKLGALRVRSAKKFLRSQSDRDGFSGGLVHPCTGRLARKSPDLQYLLFWFGI